MVPYYKLQYINHEYTFISAALLLICYQNIKWLVAVFISFEPSIIIISCFYYIVVKEYRKSRWSAQNRSEPVCLWREVFRVKNTKTIQECRRLGFYIVKCADIDFRVIVAYI